MPRQIRPVQKIVIRYQLPDGTRVPKGTPGARRVKDRTEAYYATLWIDGKKKTIPLGTADLGQAWIELRKLQRLESDRRAGITDRYTEYAAVPLVDHLEDWYQALRDGGCGAERIDTIGRRWRVLRELAGWDRLSDLTGDSLTRALGRLQREEYRLPHEEFSRPARSAQTRNHYLSHAKQFARWCVDRKRLRDNPFAGIGPVNVEVDRRHDRRAPTDEEIGLLMDYLHSDAAVTLMGMTGPQRAIGYRVAMATGFRAGELRSLSRESFDLESGTVSVPAAYSKRKRRDTQPLPSWLVLELARWLPDHTLLWPFPEEHPGRILQRDLELAGIPYRIAGPDGPLFFDFHSLRHWYCTWAANLPGISPKTLMELCRHSTPALTMRVYAKARRHDLHEAVDQMPDPGNVESEQRKKQS